MTDIDAGELAKRRHYDWAPLLLLPVLFNGLKVPRWEGALLLAAYAGFVAWQVVVAGASPVR